MTLGLFRSRKLLGCGGRRQAPARSGIRQAPHGQAYEVLLEDRLELVVRPDEPHWVGMAVMAIGLVLMVVLASARTEGWRIVAWLTGLGSVAYGTASIVFATYPGSDVPDPSSEGAVWGALAIVWGLVVIALAERRARAR